MLLLGLGSWRRRVVVVDLGEFVVERARVKLFVLQDVLCDLRQQHHELMLLVQDRMLLK